MNRFALILATFTLGFTSVALAVGAKNAAYVGGTLSLTQKQEGVFDTAADKSFTFQSAGQDGASWTLSYDQITDLEYGQKAGRRVAVAVLVTPLALFSKKRNHYLTISFTDHAGQEQGAVFELGKDIIRPVLEVLRVRTSKSIYCQDEEARKDYGGCVVRAAKGR